MREGDNYVRFYTDLGRETTSSAPFGGTFPIGEGFWEFISNYPSPFSARKISSSTLSVWPATRLTAFAASEAL